MRTAHTVKSAGRVGVAITVLLFLVAPAAFGQSSVVHYLDSKGVPDSTFQSAAPGGALANLDQARNSDPGLTIAISTASPAETDPTKYQRWTLAGTAISLDGSASLTIAAAMKDFGEGKAGHLTAYLLDCNGPLTSCTTIASGSVSAAPWSATDGWETRGISFGDVTHEVASNRKLSVMLMVNESLAEDDMWIAYDADLYPSRLTYTAAGPAPTTTTTTTTQATTTTTQATTTTTTTQATTTTTQATTTTTQATTAQATTTTTQPATTTTSIAGAGSDSPLATGGTSAPAETPGVAEPIVEVTAEDSGTDDSSSETTVEDLALPSMATAEDLAGDMAEDSMTGRILGAVELVLPGDAAAVVVSPLLVLTAILEALFTAGSDVSMAAAAAGFVSGWLIVASRRRRQGAPV